MIYNYKNTLINYEMIGDGKQKILFLHGWGGDIDSFRKTCQKTNNCTGILIDFPPFGGSETPKSAWDIFEYASMVIELLDYLKIKKITIIAHSFGGRVAIILASSYTDRVEKLVITGGAGIKPKFNIKVRMKILAFKIIKYLSNTFASDMGSPDYKILSPIMKKSFTKIVNQDLSKYAKLIKCKTLLIWGENDNDTPLYMAIKLKKIISKSELIVFENCSHFAYIENNNKFCRVVNKFIGV